MESINKGDVVQKWEYHRLFIDATDGDVSGKLDSVGERGWELVGMAHLVHSNFSWFIFKRPKP